MKDALGTRMKENYENRTRYFLPRRSYSIIRLDGKAFHTFTKGMNKPYDETLMGAMDFTTENLCAEIQGVKFGYTQSDEISLLLTDFKTPTTSAYYDGNIQKIVSVSASIATYYFNLAMKDYVDKPAFFDSRVFTISDPIEVENAFIWRQKDAIRNSISMVAQSLYSHKELNGKNCDEMQDMCFEKGVNWNDMPDGFKRGRLITKTNYQKEGATRSKWVTNGALWFTKERDKLRELIPNINEEPVEA